MIIWSSRYYLSTWQTGSSLRGSVVNRENPSKMNSCSSWWMIVGCWKNAKSSLSNLKVNNHWLLSINRSYFLCTSSVWFTQYLLSNFFTTPNIFNQYLFYQNCSTNTLFTKPVFNKPLLPIYFTKIIFLSPFTKLVLLSLSTKPFLPNLFYWTCLPILFYHTCFTLTKKFVGGEMVTR